MAGLGTFINTATVVFGGGCGVFFGRKIPNRVKDLVVQTIGLVTIGLGLSDVLKTHNMVIPLVSLVAGGIIGEILRIESGLERLGSTLQRRFASGSDESSFVRGFVTASLLFCVGPLTILGALEDASGKTPQLYIIKGTLDGFMSMILTAAHGIGAAFSALSVFVVQGILTLGGTSIDAVLTERMQTEMFATGGFAVLAIGLNLLQLTKIRLGSLIPSLVVAPLIVWIFAVPSGLVH
ncbi:MAG: DUF554 domain-containing protein [Ilumatobacteraceae bacterium]